MNSKSRRKFRIWDNNMLFHTYQQVIQIKEKIEEQCINSENTEPKQLPTSALDTGTLYDIVSCYEAMYDKLLEQELLTAGYSPKQSKSYH